MLSSEGAFLDRDAPLSALLSSSAFPAQRENWQRHAKPTLLVALSLCAKQYYRRANHQLTTCDDGTRSGDGHGTLCHIAERFKFLHCVVCDVEIDVRGLQQLGKGLAHIDGAFGRMEQEGSVNYHLRSSIRHTRTSIRIQETAVLWRAGLLGCSASRVGVFCQLQLPAAHMKGCYEAVGYLEEA